MKENETRTYLEAVNEFLDETFPKGRCKERGSALVLVAKLQIFFERLLWKKEINKEKINRVMGWVDEENLKEEGEG